MTLLLDAVLALTLVEAIVLAALRRNALLRTLLAGVLLLLATRFALAGAGLLPIAITLAAAGLAHANDLRARWTE